MRGGLLAARENFSWGFIVFIYLSIVFKILGAQKCFNRGKTLFRGSYRKVRFRKNLSQNFFTFSKTKVDTMFWHEIS